MAKPKKKPTPPPAAPVMGPRFVAYYHDNDEGHRLCLAWLERAPIPNPDGLRPVVAVHVIRRDEVRGALYMKLPADRARYLKSLTVKQTASQVEDYFAECLLTKGNGQAPKETYDILNCVKPVVEVQQSGEVAEHTEELYRRCAKIMEVTVEELKKKYAHLNPGLQAMNLRNRLRARGQSV